LSAKEINAWTEKVKEKDEERKYRPFVIISPAVVLDSPTILL